MTQTKCLKPIALFPQPML